jgi:hypothetical protein
MTDQWRGQVWVVIAKTVARKKLQHMVELPYQSPLSNWKVSDDGNSTI